MTTNKKDKTLLIFIQNGLGGAEKVSIEIANMLIEDGWSIKFIICNFFKRNQTNKLIDYMTDKYKWELFSPQTQLSIFYGMFKILRNESPNVVFCSAMHINQRLLLLSPFFPKVKFIMRNENYLSTSSPLKRKALKYTYKFADKIISQTEEMENELIGIKLNPDKIITLKNPINEKNIIDKSNKPSPYPISKDKIFVAVGRISQQKGFDVLIKAFKIVYSHISNCKLYIVGNTELDGGKIYNELKILTKSLNLEDKVIFTGFQENPYNYIKNADVFVLSSRNEGLPNVLIEAQFLRKSCVATTCIPIISRIIKDGFNGFLARSEDPKSLAEAMINALELKNINMTYKPASVRDFQLLFENALTAN